MGNGRRWSRDVIPVWRLRTYPGPIPHSKQAVNESSAPRTQRPVLSDGQGAAAPGRGSGDGSPPWPARPWLKASVLLVRFAGLLRPWPARCASWRWPAVLAVVPLICPERHSRAPSRMTALGEPDSLSCACTFFSRVDASKSVAECMDFDQEARERTFNVKIAAAVQPIPPPGA
jgi:hypothetical protein